MASIFASDVMFLKIFTQRMEHSLHEDIKNAQQKQLFENAFSLPVVRQRSSDVPEKRLDRQTIMRQSPAPRSTLRAGRRCNETEGLTSKRWHPMRHIRE